MTVALIVDPDDRFAQAVVAELGRRGIKAVSAPTIEAAADALLTLSATVAAVNVGLADPQRRLWKGLAYRRIRTVALSDTVQKPGTAEAFTREFGIAAYREKPITPAALALLLTTLEKAPLVSSSPIPSSAMRPEAADATDVSGPPRPAPPEEPERTSIDAPPGFAGKRPPPPPPSATRVEAVPNTVPLPPSARPPSAAPPVLRADRPAPPRPPPEALASPPSAVKRFDISGPQDGTKLSEALVPPAAVSRFEVSGPHEGTKLLPALESEPPSGEATQIKPEGLLVSQEPTVFLKDPDAVFDAVPKNPERFVPAPKTEALNLPADTAFTAVPVTDKLPDVGGPGASDKPGTANSTRLLTIPEPSDPEEVVARADARRRAFLVVAVILGGFIAIVAHRVLNPTGEQAVEEAFRQLDMDAGK